MSPRRPYFQVWTPSLTCPQPPSPSHPKATSGARPGGGCPVKVCHPGSSLSAFCCVALSRWLNLSEPQTIIPVPAGEGGNTQALGDEREREGGALGDPPAAPCSPCFRLKGEGRPSEPPNPADDISCCSPKYLFPRKQVRESGCSNPQAHAHTQAHMHTRTHTHPGCHPD